MRFGLVLGGGGLTGTAFHAGVITALADHLDARDAEVIVGTSAGSTAAALMRRGFPPRDYVPRMLGDPLSEQSKAILGAMPPLSDPLPPAARARRPASPDLLGRVARRPWRYRPTVALAAALPVGSRPVDPGALRLQALFEKWPEDPMWLVAVDLDSGERVAFGRDLNAGVGEAVAASCAVPGYFEPVAIGGRRYVDGGAYSMLSLDLVAGLDLDLVIVSAPLATADWFAADLGNAPRVLMRAQLEREMRTVCGQTRVVVVAPDRHLRAVMGTNSMVAAKRPPVAAATREYASAIFAGTL